MPRNTNLRDAAKTVALSVATVLALGAPMSTSPAPSSPPNGDRSPQGPSLQIVDGVRADPRNWPGFAALRVAVGENSRDYFCGGVAIARDWVLTAGHCDLGAWRQIEAVIGARDLGDVRAGQVYRVAEVVRHPGYGHPFTDGNDLALLRLARPYAGPVTDIAHDDDHDRAIDAPLLIAGHGRRGFEVAGVEMQSPDGGGAYAGSRALREAEMASVPTETCRSAYRDAFGKDYAIGPEQLCAVPATGTSGGASCRGDSGGPLVAVGADGRPRVVGLVSWAYRCADSALPTVFTRVASFSTFIETVISGGS